jgi:hypothetical protein
LAGQTGAGRAANGNFDNQVDAGDSSRTGVFVAVVVRNDDEVLLPTPVGLINSFALERAPEMDRVDGAL